MSSLLEKVKKLEPPKDKKFLHTLYDGFFTFLYTPDQGSPVPVFVDGPPHDSEDTARHDRIVQEQLEDVGYLVVRFHHRDRWETIVARFPSVFGVGSTPRSTPPAQSSEPEPEPAHESPEELLDLFEPEWHDAVRRLAAHSGLRIEGGGDLGTRVSTEYVAQLDYADRRLFIVDATAPDADAAMRLLKARGDLVLALDPNDPNPLAAVLRILEG